MSEELSNMEALMDNPQVLQLLFHPRNEPKSPLPKDSVDIATTVGDGVLVGCRAYTASKKAPIILFYHGNGEIVADYDEIGGMYQEQGINFAVAEFRGYGWSEGTPLVSTFLSDANQVFDQLKQWFIDNEYIGDLFVMGRSLGSACAIDIAVNKAEELTGMIIESGFAQTLPLAKTLGLDLEAFGVQEEQTFNNDGKITAFEKPTLILHGQYDQLIPVWQAERLHAQCGGKKQELQIVPGADHNSLITVAGVLYFQTIKKWIDKVCGNVPDWRERRRAFKKAQQEAATQNDE